MRYLAIILCTLFSVSAYGQGKTPFGASRAQDTSVTAGQIRATAYGIINDTAIAIFLPGGFVKQVSISRLNGSGGTTDTTSLSNRINGKLDSIKISNDTLYSYKNGVRTFVGIISSGGSTYTNGYGLNLAGNRFDIDTSKIPNYRILGEVINDSNDLLRTYIATNYYNKTQSDERFLQVEVDGSTTNELQTLTANRAGNNVTVGVSSGNQVTFNISDPDSSNTNELQTLSLGVDDSLQISSGNKVKLPYLRTYTETDPEWNANKANYYDISEVDDLLSAKKDNTDSTGQTGYVTHYQHDTAKTNIRTQIGLKLNIADTGLMLMNYARIQALIDTAAALRTAINLKLNIVDTTNKWLYKVDNGYGITLGGTIQRPLLSVDTSTNGISTLYDIRKLTNAVIADTVNNVQAVSGIIRFTRTAGTNTISLLTDGDHKPINVDSIWINGNDIIVRFKETCTQIYDFVIGNDESTQGIHTGQGSINNITGAYTMGASVALNVATIRVSKPAKMTASFTYNGTSWNVAAQPSTSPFSWTSPALTVTYSSGRVRINTASSFEVTGSPIAICQPANGDANLMYDVACEYLSTTQSDFYFHNAMGKLTASTPPTGLGFVVDFGVATVRVNPTTEDFGSAGNFWFTGKVKIIK